MEGQTSFIRTQRTDRFAPLEHSGEVSLAGSRSPHRVIGSSLCIDSGCLSASLVHRAHGDEMVPLLQAQVLPAQPPEPRVLKVPDLLITGLSHMLFLNPPMASGGLECSDRVTHPSSQGLEVSPI